MAVWAIVPAAGVGARVGGVTPKQYLPLDDQPVIIHTLQRLSNLAEIDSTLVVIGPQDSQFASLATQYGLDLEIVIGGAERCHSVMNALRALEGRAAADDWVLVHDAARPCVRPIDIQTLLQHVSSHPVGGLLARPVADTLKQANQRNEVVQTLDRSQFWHALTPQVFRYSLLLNALSVAIESENLVTDDASAIEHAGLSPLIVPGNTDNIKITHAVDLQLAELILAQQKKEQEQLREQQKNKFSRKE